MKSISRNSITEYFLTKLFHACKLFGYSSHLVVTIFVRNFRDDFTRFSKILQIDRFILTKFSRWWFAYLVLVLWLRFLTMSISLLKDFKVASEKNNVAGIGNNRSLILSKCVRSDSRADGFNFPYKK